LQVTKKETQMHSLITEDLSRVREQEIQAGLPRHGSPDRAATVRRHRSDRIVIRRSAPGDGPALNALAELDGRRWNGGPALVAEVDGWLRAALPLDGGRSFADPFEASAEAVALLELRSAQLETPQRARLRPRWAFAR
jgi:hypothetical protein